MLKPTKLAEAVAPSAVWLVKKPPISGKKGLPVWSQFFISQGRKGNDPSTAKRVASEIHVPTPLFGWLTRASANRKTNSNQTTRPFGDRKSTRLNSSHVAISYAAFRLKKKKRRDT